MSAELAERLRLRRDLCMEYRNSYFDIIGLFGPTVHAIIVNRCNQRDVQLAAEANQAIVAHMANGGYAIHIRLKTQLELQTILCAEYRNAYFTVINLLGAGIFNHVRDHHRQRDGVLEAEAAKTDDMIERIRHAVD